MLIRDSQWWAIREQFSNEDKAELNKSVTGETICPRGFCIELESIKEPLRTKLRDALNEARRK
jgi:hypothetical protein